MDLYKNVELRKAVSMSLFLKKHAVSSAIHDYSVNKIRLLTGLSANVIKKHVDILLVYGLAEFVGKKKDIFILHTLKSGTKHRNVYINDDNFEYNGNIRKNNKAQRVKHIDDLLCIAMITEIQKHKDYAKHIIQKKEKPKNLQEFKTALSTCKNAGWGKFYVENGLSYSTIAQRLGVGVQKAFLLIKKAVEQKILKKVNNIKKVLYPGAIYIQDLIKSYTYIYKDYVYQVNANTYIIL